MRYSTTAIVLAAMSIGEAVAGPTHVHRHKHEKKSAAVDWEALDWAEMGINWSSAYEAGLASKTGAAAAASTEVSSAVAAVAEVAENKVAAHTTTASVATSSATTSASSSKSTTKASSTTKTSSTTKASSTTSSSDALASLWNDLVGLANEVTSFGASTSSTGDEISATGNIGSPQGSNMMKVSSATGYNFTANFINTSGKSMTVVVWNKAYNQSGTVEANLGSCLAPTIPILSFALAAGEEQMVAFDTDSLVGWAETCSDITPAGAFATTWGEASFNPGASGYDMSAIVNVNGNNYNMSISSTEAPQCTSDPTQNYWLTDTQPIGDSDGSCYIAQDTATLTVKMGGTM